MPPNPGAIASTVATISSGSLVARQIGQASTPPNSLNSIALPSITGIAASGPMSPSPSTALPSVTTATVLRLIVRFQTFSGSLGDRLADARDARRVGHREVVARLERHLRAHLDLAAEVQQEGAVGDVLDLDARRARAPPRRSVRGARRPRRARVTSRTLVPRSTRTRSIASSMPPASPIARATLANEPGAFVRRTRRVALNEADVRDTERRYDPAGHRPSASTRRAVRSWPPTRAPRQPRGRPVRPRVVRAQSAPHHMHVIRCSRRMGRGRRTG